MLDDEKMMKKIGCFCLADNAMFLKKMGHSKAHIFELHLSHLLFEKLKFQIEISPKQIIVKCNFDKAVSFDL